MRPSRNSHLVHGLLWAAIAVAFLSLATPAAEASETCSRGLNDAKPGAALDPPIALTPTTQSAQRQVNFGADRDQKLIRDLTVSTNKPLPPSLTADQLNFEALLSRSGESLESTDFPDPGFTEPKISPDRKSIEFSVCLDPDGISPGKYVGAITVAGPAGLSATSINVTVTAKEEGLFWVGLSVSLAVAFCLLVLKDAATAFDAQGKKWGKALLVPLKDLRWWGATFVTLGAAFGALYAIYNNDPTWGATGFASISALVGSAFAAIGGHSIVTSFSTK
ncbi:MAG TPA: hypothetical protein VII45_11135 [Solirubrobacterales bacterium]